MWKKGKKYFFPLFYFCLLKTNTNDTHMQNFIQIPEKMKTGVQNVFKWEMGTLPFTSKSPADSSMPGGASKKEYR